MTRLLFAVFLLSISMAGTAATPELAGSVALPAPATVDAASANGKLLLILQGSGERHGGLQVIDTTDIAHPRLRGFLPDVVGNLAVSDDGKMALLVSATEKPQFGRDTGYRVTAFDLSDPDHPKVAWRRGLKAGTVALSASANAYAWTTQVREKQGNHWNVSVVRLDQNQRKIMFSMDQYAPGDFSLSPHAKFLVYDTYGQLVEWDLRAARPASYKQAYSTYARYDCIAAVLDDGHTVVTDRRAPRLGIYQWAPGLPRAAALPLRRQAEDCRWSNYAPGVPRHDELILPVVEGTVRQVSFAHAARPVVVRSWQPPHDIYPLAYGQNILFATTGNTSPEFRVYHLDRLNTTTVDWLALEKAHAAILKKYRANLKRHVPFPSTDASFSFEQAGFPSAIAAPVRGISPQEAAAMLNDYGFLANKVPNKQAIAEQALRRAIELDPQRALAHLNLADLLRARLGEASSDPVQGAALRKEIMAQYQAYLRLGGKATTAIRDFFARVPGVNARSNACATIAAYANAGRLDELTTSWGSDISYQGRKIDLLLTTQGTGHFPVAYAYDSKTDFPLDDDALPSFPDDGGDGCCGGDLSLVTLRDGAYILAASDMHHPQAATSLTTNETCRFTTTTKETVGPKATDPEMCRALQQKRGITRYAFDEDSPLGQNAIISALPDGVISGIAKVDFANNGHPLTLAKVYYSPPGGISCTGVAFHLMNADGTKVVTDTRSLLLGRLQGSLSGNIPDYHCFSTADFFKYRKRTYFETLPETWPPQSDDALYQLVSTVKNGKVINVCDFHYATRVTVR